MPGTRGSTPAGFRVARAVALRAEGRDHDREFEYGLAMLVAGCRAMLDRR